MDEPTDASVHRIQMNKWTEELKIGDIEGQDELTPQDGRDYVLQMIVSPQFTTVNADKTRYTYTLKRIAGWKLICVPQGDKLEQNVADE